MSWELLGLLLRWIHIGGGIIWMGHNYVNVVLHPGYEAFWAPPPGADDPERQGREKREHAIFRHASLVTWITGLLMLWEKGWLADALLLHGYLAVIGTATWIGTAMMLNVWLVLWPHQKRVLGFVPASPEMRLRCSRITFLSSRTNTMLSIPLLFLMAASQHGAVLFV
jgi:uncharacterized membrane protein